MVGRSSPNGAPPATSGTGAEVVAAVAAAASELSLALATADSLTADVAQDVTSVVSDLLGAQESTGAALATEAAASIQTTVFELARAATPALAR